MSRRSMVILLIATIVSIWFSLSLDAQAADPAFPWEKAKAVILKAYPQASIVGYHDEGNGSVVVIFTSKPDRWFGMDTARFILLSTDKGQKWLLTGQSASNTLIE